MKKLNIKSYYDRIFFKEEDLLVGEVGGKCVIGFTYSAAMLGRDIEFVRADLWCVRFERWLRRKK